MHSIATTLVDAALRRRLRLATAESCTGGMVAAALTDIPGASACFVGGIVAYDNAVKQSALGVSQQMLNQHGAVSEETACAMCSGLVERLHATAAVSITGIAGPTGGTADKPVGTVCFGFCLNGQATTAQTHHFTGDRQAVRSAATKHALLTLTELINQT